MIVQVGVTQDGDGALRPVAGWHPAPAPVAIDDVIDRLISEHEAMPPRRGHLLDGTPADVPVYGTSRMKRPRSWLQSSPVAAGAGQLDRLAVVSIASNRPTRPELHPGGLT